MLCLKVPRRTSLFARYDLFCYALWLIHNDESCWVNPDEGRRICKLALLASPCKIWLCLQVCPEVATEWQFLMQQGAKFRFRPGSSQFLELYPPACFPKVKFSFQTNKVVHCRRKNPSNPEYCFQH